MCHQSVIEFGTRIIQEDFIRGKSVIEVGSMNFNGSLRSVVEMFRPRNYIGIDMRKGLGVDHVCRIEDLTKEFAENSFDLVLCTEVLEHAMYWKVAINNLKYLTKPRGKLLITTRSKGYIYHPCPYDFWRFEKEDMKEIFSDIDIICLESDSQHLHPGVFLFGEKKAGVKRRDLCHSQLYLVGYRKTSNSLIVYLHFCIQVMMKILKKVITCFNRLKSYLK